VVHAVADPKTHMLKSTLGHPTHACVIQEATSQSCMPVLTLLINSGLTFGAGGVLLAFFAVPAADGSILKNCFQPGQVQSSAFALAANAPVTKNASRAIIMPTNGNGISPCKLVHV